MLKLALTTGDADGIGPEVTAKALARKVRTDFIPYVFRDSKSAGLFKSLEKKYRRHVVSSLGEALELSLKPGDLVEIVDGELAPFWVQKAAVACLKGELDGMVTGPLSKTLIRESGLKDLGHTEILARLSRQKHLFQGYLGPKFCLVLATAHLPLRGVSAALTPAVLEKAILAASLLRPHVSRPNRPLGVLGINPHAGEQGLIGSEEKRYSTVLAKLRKKGLAAEGPLVPDAAFVEEQRERYSVIVAAYHDQGLIPFKMIHGRAHGAQVTLGIPFVRTSVDHGTAKDIAGKNKADAGSMCDAIDWCVRLSKSPRKKR